MDPWDEGSYHINKKLMTHIGQWPYQNRRQVIFRLCGISCIMSTFFITQIAVFCVSSDNLDKIMETIPVTLTGLISIVKLYNCYLNNKKLTRLVGFINEDFQEQRSTEERQIIINYVQEGRFYTKAYSVHITVVAMFFSFLPLTPLVLDVILPLNESRPKMYPFEAEYFIDKDSHFFLVITHMWVNVYCIVVVLVAVDTMFMTYVQHACTLFAIVGHRAEHIFDDWDRRRTYMHSNIIQTTRKKIAYCVQGHQKALQYSELLESSFKWTLFLQIGIVLLILTFTFVQIVLNLSPSPEILRYMFYAGGQFIHLLCYSYPAQSLQDHSLAILQNVYNSLWYEASPSVQEIVVFIMLKSMKPCVVTAGGYYILCLDSFMMVVQSAMSYFMVLSSVS